MFSDKLFERNNPPGVRGLLLVFGCALLGAWLVVQAAVHWRGNERGAERARLLQQTVDALRNQGASGDLLGAVSLLGLNEPLLKDLAQGRLAPDDPGALARLALARGRFPVHGVYVLSGDGVVVAHETAGERSTGQILALQPYFEQAMRGAVGVHAAVGSHPQERALYYAAPLYEADTPLSAIIGVVLFKAGFEFFDGLLRRQGLPAVLLSPQGVVLASTRPEWQFALAPPLTQERIDALRESRRFGLHFDNGVASALPFAPDAGEVVLNGVAYAVERRGIDWDDPAGPWQLVVLDDISALMALGQRVQVGGVAFLLLLLPGGLLLDLLRSRARVATVLERFWLLGTALQSSPVSVVITDGDGCIEWVNSQYERNTGYTLAEVRGRKPSLLASGQTCAQTYQTMWSTLLTGQSWRGRFVNRRKDGSIYHDEATLLPVFDRRGRRIGIVGLHAEVPERVAARQKRRPGVS
ncbi:PAS domain-containing protein [Verminephrobacter aporrectodeae]|uniref:PAS domain-containing protein n=1 Tax=Verminephrobacter aporrectodeae TaxID=1110389 RepID=UPI0022438A6A|nr:PAS domain-containing protein [Verminephrobacter aporrectodeae]MCW8176967.1 PAS domain S-box protein [Verminephrobacter aporrectodeae subsp. tuberculatae]MCW8202548.1 PAS domain S-box protein [Verminephrobacter aporrectodeae subsp. tuberculatae]